MNKEAKTKSIVERRRRMEQEQAEVERLKAEADTKMSNEIIDFIKKDYPASLRQGDIIAFLQKHLPGHNEYVIPVTHVEQLCISGNVRVRARSREDAERIAKFVAVLYAGEAASDIGYIEGWDEHVREVVTREIEDGLRTRGGVSTTSSFISCDLLACSEERDG